MDIGYKEYSSSTRVAKSALAASCHKERTSLQPECGQHKAGQIREGQIDRQ